jgi:hypothetical protein
MTDRELMQMTLDALLWVDQENRIFSQRESIRRLRERLAQPHLEWVGLTDDEFKKAIEGLDDIEDCWQAIEAKLKERNT